MSETVALATKRIDVGGLSLNVMDVGEGKPVLLVHGFPDSHTVWRKQIPVLVNAGYRVLAPDTRGRGDSDMAPNTSDYRWSLLAADMVALLDALNIDRAQVVAHDWGAWIGWQMASTYPDRVEKYIALSVGHPNAYARGGFMQKLKGWYIFTMQFRGLFELSFRAFNWFMLRAATGYPAEVSDWIRLLEPAGRLTAGVNYYRANFVDLVISTSTPNVHVPVIGVFSDGDRFLTEGQMKRTGKYCDAGFQYIRVSGANHWMQLDASHQINALLLQNLNPVDS